MKKLKTLIVDDEFNCRENLKMLVDDYCEELDVVALAKSAEEARKLIAEHEPEVVFLDIKMPTEDGFTFLKSMPDRKFSVIFTTAHNEYALKAFKANAIDYLEKPINIEELQNAVLKLKALHEVGEGAVSDNNGTIQRLLEDAVHFEEIEKTTIPTRDGFAVVKSTDIVRLEASDCYTTIYLTEGRKYVSSKNIKVYEESLNARMFFRTHKSHIINILYHLKEFSRSEGNIAVMTNGHQVPIARRKLGDFLGRTAQF
jgi:two-component system LytT family response regulator